MIPINKPKLYHYVLSARSIFLKLSKVTTQISKAAI